MSEREREKKRDREREKESGCKREGDHARPFEPPIKSRFWKISPTFDDKCPQNGSKYGSIAPSTGLGYPHEGPSVGWDIARRKRSAPDPHGSKLAKRLVTLLENNGHPVATLRSTIPPPLTTAPVVRAPHASRAASSGHTPSGSGAPAPH